MSDTTGAPPATAPQTAEPRLPTPGPRKAAANKVQQGGVSLTEGLRMLTARGNGAAAPAAPVPPTPPAARAASEDTPGATRKPSARQRLAEAADAANGAMPAPQRTPPQRQTATPAPASAPAAQPSAGDHPLDAIMAAFSGGEMAAPASEPAPGASAPEPTPAPTNAYLAPIALEIGGKRQEFTHEQLTDFVSKGVDYTAKTQSLGEVSRHIQQQQQILAELLPVLVPEVERQLALLNGQSDQPPDWRMLADTDPAEYVRQDAAWKAGQTAREAEKARLEHIRKAAEAEQARQTSERMRVSHLDLLKTVPGWSNQATRQRIQSEMMAWGKKEGFPATELESIVEARHIKTMLKAMMFDRMVAGAKTRAPVVPTVQRGTAPAAPAPAAVRDAQQRFERRSSMNNAVKFAVALKASQRRSTIMGS